MIFLDAITCRRCGVEKPANQDFFQKTLCGGMSGTCRECRRERGNELRRERRRAAAESGNRPVLSESERQNRNASVRRFYLRNRELVLSYQRQYRKANPEKRAEWRRNRRSRMRNCTGTHTAGDIAGQLSRQQRRCYWCRTRLTDYHVDHVMPLALGGNNGPENIVVACPTCNLRKQDAHPMDWAGVML